MSKALDINPSRIDNKPNDRNQFHCLEELIERHSSHRVLSVGQSKKYDRVEGEKGETRGRGEERMRRMEDWRRREAEEEEDRKDEDGRDRKIWRGKIENIEITDGKER